MKRSKKSVRQGRRGPNGLQDEINLDFRKDISSGACKPGSRLPSRAELEKRYRTTPTTIQQAFDKLTEDKFIVSKGKRGTFVADYPPCLSNYAIVFPSHFDSNHHEVSFWRVLANLAKSNKYAPEHRFTIYTDLNGHTDEPDYIRLAEDLQAKRLAGIIFASSPYNMDRTPLFKDIISQKDLPKVAFMSGPPYSGLPTVSTCHEDSLCMVFNYLQNRGVKRLAVLNTHLGQNKFEEFPNESNLYAETKKRGIQLLPHNVQVMHSLLFPRARQLTQLMLHGRQGERPDALLILDDSLVEYASKGIAESGLKVPGELTVITYCNFPEPPQTAVPVTFFGLDVNAVLDKCLEVMDCQRNGRKYPEVSVIPTEFGDSVEGEVVGRQSSVNFEE